MIDVTYVTTSSLFANIPETQILSLCTDLHAFLSSYSEQQVLHDEMLHHIGFLVKGTLQLSKHEYNGNRLLLTNITQGDVFGEVFAILQPANIPFYAKCCEACEILWFPYQTMMNTSSWHPQQGKLLQNLHMILARKNLLLNQRIEILSKRSTKEKLLSYLSEVSRQVQQSSFSIPYNRQELADYLCVDRSALSKELAKLESNHILRYHKDQFTLL